MDILHRYEELYDRQVRNSAVLQKGIRVLYNTDMHMFVKASAGCSNNISDLSSHYR